MLVHDSQGGSAQVLALQLRLTRPWMSPGCWGQPSGSPTGHLDWSSRMGHAVGRMPRQWRPVVCSYPGSVALSMSCGPLQVVGACHQNLGAGVRAMTQSGFDRGWHPRYLAGCPAERHLGSFFWRRRALALQLFCVRSLYRGVTERRDRIRRLAVRSGQHPWEKSPRLWRATIRVCPWCGPPSYHGQRTAGGRRRHT